MKSNKLNERSSRFRHVLCCLRPTFYLTFFVRTRRFFIQVLIIIMRSGWVATKESNSSICCARIFLEINLQKCSANLLDWNNSNWPANMLTLISTIENKVTSLLMEWQTRIESQNLWLFGKRYCSLMWQNGFSVNSNCTFFKVIVRFFGALTIIKSLWCF